MPIITTDILYRGSVLTGAAGNSVAQTTPGGNLGKYVSTTLITDAVLNNVFPDVTGDENAASAVDYQCVFIHNNHATITLQSPVIWVTAEVIGGATTSIALDNIAATAVASAAVQATQISNKNIAPIGVGGFSTPTTKATGLALGNLPAGFVRGVWIKRSSANTAALNSDGLTLRVEGDTSA